MNAVALPRSLKHLEGRITDIDSHEMIPAQEWIRVFGPEIKPLADAWLNHGDDETSNLNHPNVPGHPGDILPIDADLGRVKGARAPGALDQRRRLDVMDAFGVSRQLIFPTYVGAHSFHMLVLPEGASFIDSIQGDRKGKARRWIELYNEWAIKTGKISDRLRPVAPVHGETVHQLMTQARRLIDNGIRAIWLSATEPPGGKSPAHPDLDPFWALLAETNTVTTLHIGAEGELLRTNEWQKVPQFNGYRSVGEFDTDPWTMSIFHWPHQNFLGTMINGGVFDRHPALRFGVIEVGSFWVGPMMEGLDLWHTNMGAFMPADKVPLKKMPSDYVRSNVRVSVFPFENVDVYIERYGLQDVLCFATDYPHIEGGKNALETLYNKVERLGPEIIEKFFVTNGQFLLPD